MSCSEPYVNFHSPDESLEYMTDSVDAQKPFG